MKIKNEDIINIVQNINNNFNFNEDYYPVNLDYALQTNLALFIQKLTTIEHHRKKICKHYGTLDKNHKEYIIPMNNIPQVEKEIEYLYGIEQDVPIMKVKLTDIEDISLTFAQLEAISFMIEE